jgi:hypothetical protein
MPCIDDKATASHRPMDLLPVLLFLEAIQFAATSNGHGEAGEPVPSADTVRIATNLIAEVPFRLLGDPEINPFYGELHLSWASGSKQIVLMCFPAREPLIHHYERMLNAPSVHDIEPASSERLAYWLEWLRA